jgi:hypothetical protein
MLIAYTVDHVQFILVTGIGSYKGSILFADTNRCICLEVNFLEWLSIFTSGSNPIYLYMWLCPFRRWWRRRIGTTLDKFWHVLGPFGFYTCVWSLCHCWFLMMLMFVFDLFFDLSTGNKLVIWICILNKFVTLPIGQLNWSCNLIHVKQVIYFSILMRKYGILFTNNLSLNLANL